MQGLSFASMMKTDAISEMAFFAALARKGSLSAAARELDITPPAATKRLAQMEQRLGVRLLNRTTRRFSLTSEGELYLEQAQRILDLLLGRAQPGIGVEVLHRLPRDRGQLPTRDAELAQPRRHTRDAAGV